MSGKKVYVTEQFIKQREEVILKVQCENNTLVAALNKARSEIQWVIDAFDTRPFTELLEAILNETPEQSLDAIRAELAKEYDEAEQSRKALVKEIDQMLGGTAEQPSLCDVAGMIQLMLNGTIPWPNQNSYVYIVEDCFNSPGKILAVYLSSKKAREDADSRADPVNVLMEKIK